MQWEQPVLGTGEQITEDHYEESEIPREVDTIYDRSAGHGSYMGTWLNPPEKRSEHMATTFMKYNQYNQYLTHLAYMSVKVVD